MELFDRGLEAFRQGRYFEAHELWEELWTGLAGAERRRLQGLIHFAVGLYHFGRDNRVGAERQWRKGLAKTEDCPPGWRGVEIERLRGEMAARLGELGREGTPGT